MCVRAIVCVRVRACVKWVKNGPLWLLLQSPLQLLLQSRPSDPDILNGVYMSEALNPVFVENFQRDPTLTWQYFGSSTGFFRIYPGEEVGGISKTLRASSRGTRL